MCPFEVISNDVFSHCSVQNGAVMGELFLSVRVLIRKTWF